MIQVVRKNELLDGKEGWGFVWQRARFASTSNRLIEFHYEPTLLVRIPPEGRRRTMLLYLLLML